VPFRFGISVGVANFAPFLPLNWLPWKRPLKYRKKGGHIVHLQFNTYHMVQTLWKSVQRILRYFGSMRASPVQNKIGCHGNVPWWIGKTGQDWENSRKYLPFGEKIVKIGPVDTEIALLIVKKNKQSLAYRPLGAVVSPPSEYLWKTLTYWSPECITAPSHCEHRWIKLGNNYWLRPYIFLPKTPGD